ncbi:MAG: hypothetical protein ACLPN6_22095 [Streptosporangiaceae bacterium]|nr:hypothetical protein [Actinomycetota bacterium]
MTTTAHPAAALAGQADLPGAARRERTVDERTLDEQTRARYPDVEGFLDRDGVRVFYEAYGSAEPTILLFPTWGIVHSRSWKFQIPYFARHGRVVTFDRRGNGRSDRPGSASDQLLKPVRKRLFPIIGNGGGFMSFVHLDDAATATVLALEHDGHGIYNIVDDEPAPLRQWLPVLAEALGAGPPRRIPAWLARLVAGEDGVRMGTQTRGASNARAKSELGWALQYPSWRQGFAAAYASAAPDLARPRR